MGWARGYPLLEVKLLYKESCCRVLIQKKDLYLVGYYYDGSWQLFKDIKLRFFGSSRVPESSGYQGRLCSHLGASSLLLAIEMLEDEISRIRKQGAEILFVHLSEAARFSCIRNLISDGIMDVFKPGHDAPNPREDAQFEWAGGVSELGGRTCQAVSCILAGEQQRYIGVQVSREVDVLIHSWDTLSFAWKHQGFEDICRILSTV